jgi:hypothetical protein
MQQFHKFITLRSYVAHRVSGVSPPIIRSLRLHWGNRPDHDQQRSSRCLLTVEPEAPSAVVGP